MDDSHLTISFKTDINVIWKDKEVFWLLPKDKRNHSINLGENLLQKLFFPDLYIYGLTKYNPLIALQKLESFELQVDGNISYYAEGKLTIACHMNFIDYPMDKQLCKIQFGSTMYKIELVKFIGSITYTREHQRALQYHVIKEYSLQ